jgi:hypothetical protein
LVWYLPFVQLSQRRKEDNVATIGTMCRHILLLRNTAEHWTHFPSKRILFYSGNVPRCVLYTIHIALSTLPLSLFIWNFHYQVHEVTLLALSIVWTVYNRVCPDFSLNGQIYSFLIYRSGRLSLNKLCGMCPKV